MLVEARRGRVTAVDLARRSPASTARRTPDVGHVPDPDTYPDLITAERRGTGTT